MLACEREEIVASVGSQPSLPPSSVRCLSGCCSLPGPVDEGWARAHLFVTSVSIPAGFSSSGAPSISARQHYRTQLCSTIAGTARITTGRQELAVGKLGLDGLTRTRHAVLRRVRRKSARASQQLLAVTRVLHRVHAVWIMHAAQVRGGVVDAPLSSLRVSNALIGQPRVQVVHLA